MESGVTGHALRVVLYSPTYSCNPPTLFLILSEFLILIKVAEIVTKKILILPIVTALQIVFYFMSIYAPDTLGIKEEYGDWTWPIRYKNML